MKISSIESPDMIGDDEINLWQIVDFLSMHFRILFLSCMAGALLGIGWWFLLAPCKARLVINIDKSFDYIGWRKLEQQLPLLADQNLQSGTLKDDEQRKIFKDLSSAEWWEKNVVPTFVLDKADSKKLAGINKESQEAEAITILSLIISDKQRSPETVERKLNLVADFIRQGATTIALKHFLNRIQSEVQVAGVNIPQQISVTEVERGYLKTRAKKLEILKVKFPQKMAVNSQQIVDIQEGNAKYLPIDSQLIALYSDIDRLEDSLTHLRALLAQNELKGEFISFVAKIVSKQKNGLLLVDSLINAEVELRTRVALVEPETMLALNAIRSELVTILTTYSNRVMKNPVTHLGKRSPLLPVLGGFMLGGFVMLLWLMLWQGYIGYRRMSP